MPRWLKAKELMAWLRLRRGIISDPTRTIESPPPIVEQKAQRAYTPAKPAAPWSDDISRQNADIAKAYDDELARRTALQERGEYIPRFGSPETDMAFEMRNANVTGLAPIRPVLTPVEFSQAQQVSGLTSQIQAEERKRIDPTPQIPERPTRQEILAAAGGDETRADQLEARVNELYGEAP